LNLWDPPFPLLVRNVAGAAYVATLMGLFLERFILMMHYSSHRSMFKAEFAQLNGLFVWCYAPFMGVPCGCYHLHHVVMHHIENNHGMDISATDVYQRDSGAAFFNYWCHFLFGIWVELPMYCVKSKRMQWFGKLSCGLLSYFGSIFFAARCINFAATMYVGVTPYFIAMTAMAFGNFSQHMFVDPDNSRSNYHLTYSCIDCPGNKVSFNDGYHVIHHANARLHWSELPQEFIRTQDKHMDSLTFRGIGFFDVGLMVMTGQLRKLVEKHYVHLGTAETAPTVEQMEKKMRRWLEPVPQEPLKEKKAA